MITNQELENINAIINDPGLTRKVRRALLKDMGLNEGLVDKLVPNDELADY